MDLPIFPLNNRPFVTLSDLRSLKIHDISQRVTRSFRPQLDSGGQSILERGVSADDDLGPASWTGDSPITQRRDAGLPKTTLSPIVNNSDLQFQQELIRRERQALEAERASQAAADRRLLERRGRKDSFAKRVLPGTTATTGK